MRKTAYFLLTVMITFAFLIMDSSLNEDQGLAFKGKTWKLEEFENIGTQHISNMLSSSSNDYFFCTKVADSPVEPNNWSEDFSSVPDKEKGIVLSVLRVIK